MKAMSGEFLRVEKGLMPYMYVLREGKKRRNLGQLIDDKCNEGCCPTCEVCLRHSRTPLQEFKSNVSLQLKLSHGHDLCP